ncbi:MAG: hypothetical protein M1815_000225 [Lichina confinis]|nr:MAG: hypothetical protein M1815_000225 [Lichina confinis]
MSIIQASHDSLPYVDADISAAERASAIKAIESELAMEHETAQHPSLPELRHARFSEMFERELARKADGLPWEGGIDTGRYEALDPPQTHPTSDEDQPQVLDGWRDVLRKAYTSSSHLETRLGNLALLEEFGKNAWLIGNAQMENILRRLEMELARVREQTHEVNKARKTSQESARGELEALDDGWRRGVGRVIEVEVAAEALRRDILERRRDQAARESA